jgi:hypothetical protein
MYIAAGRPPVTIQTLSEFDYSVEVVRSVTEPVVSKADDDDDTVDDADVDDTGEVGAAGGSKKKADATAVAAGIIIGMLAVALVVVTMMYLRRTNDRVRSAKSASHGFGSLALVCQRAFRRRMFALVRSADATAISHSPAGILRCANVSGGSD